MAANLDLNNVNAATATLTTVVIAGGTGIFTTITPNAIVGGDNSLGITGQTQATTVNGGAVVITGAASISGATGNGGAVSQAGGASGSTDGDGGAASSIGGVATGTGTGGAATLMSGASGGASGFAGTLTIDTGSAAGGVGEDIDIGLTNATNVRLGRSGGTVFIEGIARTTIGNGAGVVDKCLVVEGGNGVIHQTTLTFILTGAHDLDMADDDHGTGIKIYDFPAGSIQILGATCNAIATSVNTGAGGGTYPMALGSEVGADDNTLTGTEADIIPSTAITGGTGSTASDFHATLAAPILFANAGGSDLDLYLNAAITAAVAEGAVTIAVTGTVTITWINLGDY